MGRMVNIYRVINGQAQPWELPARTLAEASLALPQGVYTTLRIYPEGYVVRLDDHLARLESSARILGRPLGLDRGEVRHALGQAFWHSGFPQARARLAATPPPKPGHPDVSIALEEFLPPDPEIYTQGVRVRTIGALRTHHPQAKTTDFIATSRRLYREMPSDAYERLMVDEDGRILEGLTSNFFALKEGAVYTAGHDVLEGVTRGIVIELAARLLPVRLESVRQDEVARLSEAFITSSSREIVPVVAIDDVTIGDGRPGPITRRLLETYRSQIRREWQRL